MDENQINDNASNSDNQDTTIVKSEQMSDEEIFANDPLSEEENTSDEEEAEQENENENEANDEENQEQPKPKNKVQARIDEITKARKEAEERAERAERRIAELEKANDKPLVEPDELDFDDPAEYKKALVQYGKEVAKREVQQQQQIQPSIDRLNATFEQVRKEVPNFQELLNASDAYGSVNSPALRQALIDSEHGAYLLLEMVKDPKKGADLSRLAVDNPAKFYREVGKIEAKLSLNNNKSNLGLKSKKIQPKPIKPVTAGGVLNKNIEDMTTEEYVKFRRKQGSSVF